jgi:hypothetical protein
MWNFGFLAMKKDCESSFSDRTPNIANFPTEFFFFFLAAAFKSNLNPSIKDVP